jgi:hypothetical protein
MGMLIFLTILFLLIAQAMGLLAYYSKRNKYSKAAQSLATFLPAGVFMGLTVAGCGLLLLLKWWVADEGWKAVARELLTGHPPLGVLALGYTVAGGVVSMFLSILIQLGILVFHPPKYQRSRRRRKRSAEVET